ncbi:DUF4747 family protein [Rhizobium sp. FKL33]|uniref:DUF4747 family protein n=1 Tax=Rhizobium sp. FKL33 TaxID=2562307 RepID=UPI0010C01A6E|nr:DUF4747 family protein [Rhizobium sp. FKL33]
MARKIKVSAASLNIRLHPHSPEIYMDWMVDIYRKKLIGPVHGDRHAMISTLDASKANDGIIRGVITTFIKFDSDGDWFNSEKLEEATKDDVSEIKIPDNLHYNPAQFYFTFYARYHRLYFQTYSNKKVLTPPSAHNFFSHLSRDLDVMEKFGEAQISIVQDRATLDKMFKIERIKEISVTILKPNTDVFDDDFEKNIEAHLANTKSREFTVKYKADARGSIEPDDDIKRISKIALDNGSVKVIGRDDKGAVNLNSEKYPEEFHDKFDPDVQSERSAFDALLPAVPRVAR